MELPDSLRITMEVIEALEKLGVPALVGGSLASSIHGAPRSTLDSDIVADLRPQHIQPLVASLSSSFYIEPERAEDAIRRRASFNLIHHKTGFKVDIFILKDNPLARLEMSRIRRVAPLPGLEFPVASPEDIILQKLHWYQMGNRVSERQWLDVLGVLKVQRDRLDFAYLKQWAASLDVGDLLQQGFDDAGIR